jgi:N-acetylneuraminic acid mutarotase
MKKGKYQKALLTWDHHGSGRDHKQSPEQVRDEIQNKLDSYTWSDNSSVTIFVPELEQWLWYCENALISYCGISAEQLNTWLVDRSAKLGKSVDVLKDDQPKELFEYVMRERLKRTISPRDFAEIGKLAGVTGLMNCESFRSVAEVLRAWFPQ